MSEAGLQKAIVILLAIASASVTALVAMTVYRQYSQTPAPNGQTPPTQTADGAQPPVLATLPGFTLTSSQGQPLGLSDLRGKVWIADFIFTTCRGPCPMMTSQMATLQMKLKDHPRWPDIRLVSITVDPETDTPEKLKEYARLAGAEAEHWRFLTGQRETIWRLIREGFKLPVGENARDQKMPIFHSQRFVLVDQVGQIRGFYEGLEEEGREKLLADLDRVLSPQN